MTAGGDGINYPDDLSTQTGDIITTKVLINSTISTPDAKFMTINVKNIYLNTPMKRFEYIRIKLSDIPEETIKQYKLNDITRNGYAYMEVQKGIYGLPQAGILARDLLVRRLA